MSKNNSNRRKWIILLAILLLIVSLLAAIMDSDPDYMCGRWWYGMIATYLFINQVKPGKYKWGK